MQTGQFRTAPDAVRLIISKEGFKGFYAVRNFPILPLLNFYVSCIHLYHPFCLLTERLLFIDYFVGIWFLYFARLAI